MEIPESEMIILMVPDRVLLSCDLTPEQKFVYMMIWNFRDVGGIFELSKDLQKSMLRKSYKNLSANLAVLVKFGYIEIEQHGEGVPVIKISTF
jgi:hypothetical protein